MLVVGEFGVKEKVETSFGVICLISHLHSVVN